MALYQDDFYANRHERTIHAANAVLSIVLDLLPPVHSAIDVGCGVGTWLTALRSMGVDNVQGIEGDWVQSRHLEIPETNLHRQALDRDLQIPADGGFDLALSLEVGEHLPEARAASLVTALTEASDFVLFSAAIPHQGGTGHVNEQWPEYWAGLFANHGYTGLDVVRPRIWDDSDIAFWYRQNTLLFAREDRLPELQLDETSAALQPSSVVHPETYLNNVRRHRDQMTRLQSLGGSWQSFRRALKSRVIGHH